MYVNGLKSSLLIQALWALALGCGCAGGVGAGGGGSADGNANDAGPAPGVVSTSPADGGGSEDGNGTDNGPGPVSHLDVVSTNPADGGTGVSPDTSIIITFARSADPTSIVGEINPSIVYDPPTWSADNTTVTVTPSAPLEPGTTYTLTVTELAFADGSQLTAPFSFSFTCALEDSLPELRPECANVEHERRIVYVDHDTGDDGNDGLAPERAVATITRGAQIIVGGDQLVVGPGVYYERPVFENLCSSADWPVWIRAEPRGQATISGMWPEAALRQVAWRDEVDGVYSAEHGSANFGSYDGTFLFRFNSVSDLRDGRAASVNVAVPPYGFAVEGDRIHVKLPNGVDPNGESLLFSSPGMEEPGELEAIVQVTGSPYVILDGFRIEGSGTRGASFSSDSVRATVRNTVFSYCLYGLRLPDYSIVEWSEYVYPGLHDFAESLMPMNGNLNTSVYTLAKEYHNPVQLEGGIAESYGLASTSVHCEFKYNFLHETVDGEKLGEFEYSESHHNVYMYNYDNHVELESWAGFGSRELRLHDSLLLACPQGPISHQDDQENGIVGPQYVYRNVIYGLDEHGWPSWTQIKSRAPNATEGIFYYHNILWATTGELFWEFRENLHFRNNMFIFSENTDIEQGTLDSDYNLLINDDDKPWLYGPNGEYAGTNAAALGFLDVSNLNFGISAGSRAENAGVELPGFNDGSPGGPDIGPFEVDDPPGAEWPRARRTVFEDTIPDRWNGGP